MQYPYLYFVIGFLFSILLLRIFMPLLSSRFLDQPNSRSSHNTPIPRGGGISFVFVSLLSSLIASFFNYHSLVLLPFLLLPLAFVGFLDDFYNITSSIRFSVQLLSAFFFFTQVLYTKSLIFVSQVFIGSFSSFHSC